MGGFLLKEVFCYAVASLLVSLCHILQTFDSLASSHLNLKLNVFSHNIFKSRSLIILESLRMLTLLHPLNIYLVDPGWQINLKSLLVLIYSMCLAHSCFTLQPEDIDLSTSYSSPHVSRLRLQVTLYLTFDNIFLIDVYSKGGLWVMLLSAFFATWHPAI